MTKTVEEREPPKFRVTQAPGFATGLQMHLPGEEIVWEVPEGWDEKKYGKHFSAYGPSVTFEPLNAAAEALQSDHKEKLKQRALAKKADPAAEALVAAKDKQISDLMQMVKDLVEASKKGKSKD